MFIPSIIGATVIAADGLLTPRRKANPQKLRFWVAALAAGCLAAIAVLFVWLIGRTDGDAPVPPGPGSTAADAPVDGSFQPTGKMKAACSWCHAMLLNDGRVLVVGGIDEFGSAAEIFDPASWTFSLTGRPVGQLAGPGSAVLLPDGRVFFSVAGEPMEIYDPTTGSFESLGRSQDSGSAALLPDGRLLVVGSAGAVLFDPITDTFVPTGEPIIQRSIIQRSSPSLTALPDGRILVLGGDPSSSAEVFDPVTGAFTRTGDMNTRRDSFTATPLLDGRVLIVGGSRIWGSDPALASAEIYDPATGRFHATGPLVVPPGTDDSVTQARFWHTATRLNDGRVIVVGGTGGVGSAVPDAEIYNPETGRFSLIAEPMTRSRVSATAVTLDDGRVLIFGNHPENGGGGSSLGSESAEIFSVDPIEPPAGCCAANPTEIRVQGQRNPGPSGPRPFKVVVPPGGLAGAVEAFFDYRTGNSGGGSQWRLPRNCDQGCEVVLPEEGEDVSLQIVFEGPAPAEAFRIVIVEAARE